MSAWEDSTDALADGAELLVPHTHDARIRTASQMCQYAYDFFGVGTGDAPELRRLGVPLVDNHLGGVSPTQTTIVAASPGVGKSTFALQCAYYASRAGTPSGIISLEDGAELMGARLYSIVSGVDDYKIRKQQLDGDDIQALQQAQRLLGGVPLYIVDADTAHTDNLAQDLVSLAKRGCKVVWIDYVQRITSAVAQSERMAIKHMLSLLQTTARTYGVTLVLISQLGRSYNAMLGAPLITQLEGCSGLEQQARLILALYPRNKYLAATIIKSTVGGEGETALYIREGSRFKQVSE